MFALAAPTWSQDSESGTEPDAAEEVQDSEAADETDISDENYSDTEDDDFRPSEEIPADQSIPFPTDI